MDTLKVNTPEELHQAIGKFLQSNYSHENLVKIYDNSLQCAASFRGIYSELPTLPRPNREDPLYGLQDIMDWSKEAAKVVNDIASNLEQQTISEIISRLKKLRGVADSVVSLVDTKLKEEAQTEARAKVEKEYANLNEEASKTEGMLLIQRAEVVGKLELEAHAILRGETEDAVQIYLSKDPAFKDRVSQLNNEIREVLERLNKLVDSDTPTGKQIDIYCTLKGIPIQSQFDDVGYAYSPIDDWADVICGGCNRLYTSIDNVIKTFKEIQTKTGVKQQTKNKVADSHFVKAGENISASGDIFWGDKNIKKQDVPIKMKENWYQTNTFKGAVIALVIALLGGGIPAWLSLGNKTDHNISENTNISSEAKTSGASSPAIATSGPNSPVNIYLSPTQPGIHSEIKESNVTSLKQPLANDSPNQEIEMEEKIGLASQSQNELIVKREASIKPSETEGEVNKPKKGELRKREPTIAPDVNEGEVRKTK